MENISLFLNQLSPYWINSLFSKGLSHILQLNNYVYYIFAMILTASGVTLWKFMKQQKQHMGPFNK